MKRAFFPAPAWLLLLGALVFAGCSSYDAQPGGPRLAAQRHIFIKSNPNDNNALDAQIVAAFKLRGYESDCGPLTMLPDEAQVIVTYEDHWTWDFGDHLAYLQIVARDRKTGQVYGTAVFQAKIPTKKSIPKILGELIDRILADAKSPKRS
jgi:hypothetical protein